MTSMQWNSSIYIMKIIQRECEFGWMDHKTTRPLHSYCGGGKTVLIQSHQNLVRQCKHNKDVLVLSKLWRSEEAMQEQRFPSVCRWAIPESSRVTIKILCVTYSNQATQLKPSTGHRLFHHRIHIRNFRETLSLNHTFLPPPLFAGLLTGWLATTAVPGCFLVCLHHCTGWTLIWRNFPHTSISHSQTVLNATGHVNRLARPTTG